MILKLAVGTNDYSIWSTDWKIKLYVQNVSSHNIFQTAINHYKQILNKCKKN